MAGHVHGATSGKMLWLSITITVFFVVLEAFFGLRSHSLALLSDAGHNASDALALGLAAYAVWVARRPASRARTFGYHRVAILTALANAGALAVIAVTILIGAWQAWLHPQAVNGTVMIGVASVAVVMNTLVAAWLSGGSRHSLNIRAVYIHMAGDALSSAAVLVAGLVIHATHWPYADPLVSILIAGFILYSSWGVIGDATNILLEGTPKDLDIPAMVAGMRGVGSVLEVHDLHVWTVGDGLHFLSCHVVLPDEFTVADQGRVLRDLNKMLQADFDISHATIQTEIGGYDGCQATPEELYCPLEPSHSHTGCAHTH